MWDMLEEDKITILGYSPRFGEVLLLLLLNTFAWPSPVLCLERERNPSHLVADVADVWPLAGVGAGVAVEQRGTVEALPAKVARKHLGRK